MVNGLIMNLIDSLKFTKEWAESEKGKVIDKNDFISFCLWEINRRGKEEIDKKLLRWQLFQLRKDYYKRKNRKMNGFNPSIQTVEYEDTFYTKDKPIINWEKVKETLTKKEHNIILLWSYGYSFEDIARKYEIRSSTIWRWYHAALEKLRENIGKIIIKEKGF